MNQNTAHTALHIDLPSGRSIEVVRFEDPAAEQAPATHVCPECASELVQPTDWIETSGDAWELTLECPNCRWRDEGVYSREEVAQLEDELDHGLTTMLEDLRRLTRANMAEQIERFVAALEADLILPEDF